MQKISLALSSPVFWTVLVAVLVAVVPIIKDFLSPTAFAVIEAVLAVLTNYFNVTPSPTFQAKLKAIDLGNINK